ncbi:Tyrosyl-DNA phosphodiesterase domain protein [Taphrina deformans PYCC 5710]|uniref:Tyrosyl-DNA phosphodiesterase domain protein n=1 Tax=Taphrina deformans (strain PYCC 5710 / ATCC 11124 / CBS 356.35 / IMI 108563 / JCM 9778 / NBRC 8474) TaxID=1097556 RepID=R4XGX6_TAPDE|nr:Tyrosyl-DNA phosphodiesterase domain protein [Taphrina deformans PYCC 5710]|eukprot:CCG82606.1 Tyrosyl-DNA phosphodiesterase domain protein [Taphrina deformans PYCC 5710]
MGIGKKDLFLTDVAERALVLCFFIEFEFLKTLFKKASLDIVTDGALFSGKHSLPPTWTVQVIAAKPFQCMHSKVFMIQCPGYMRIIVATSNLLQIDYDNLDNLFYIHDFPETSTPRDCRFKTQLLKMYRNHTVESPLVADIHRYDLSLCGVDLVVSVPGTYYGALEEHEYGQLSLSRFVSERGIPPRDEGEVVTEHCSSSIGNLNMAWMQTFRTSFMGLTGTEASAVSPQNTKLIYASFRDVAESTPYGEAGRPLAENIVCNGKWSDPWFPREYFYSYQSRNAGTLYHAKTNVAYDAGGPLWFVTGSHNFSQAAWGSVVVQGPRARYHGLKTVIANYEVSVLVHGPLLTNLIPFGLSWHHALTYRQDSLGRYKSTDSPWTVRKMR